MGKAQPAKCHCIGFSFKQTSPHTALLAVLFIWHANIKALCYVSCVIIAYGRPLYECIWQYRRFFCVIVCWRNWQVVIFAVIFFCFCEYFYAGHVEHHFGILPDRWKEIQLHIDSKCHSAIYCRSRGLPQTGQAFHHQDVDQTTTTSGVETNNSDDTGLRPQHNSLITDVSLLC